MQTVTINIPSVYIDAIGILIDKGLFPSRSEAIRVALRDFLKRELQMVEALLDLSDNIEKTKPDAKPKPRKIDMRTIQKGWS
jgi:Arc/MetJ-type ribon-helix-helix transcriptional regulator